MCQLCPLFRRNQPSGLAVVEEELPLIVETQTSTTASVNIEWNPEPRLQRNDQVSSYSPIAGKLELLMLSAGNTNQKSGEIGVSRDQTGWGADR